MLKRFHSPDEVEKGTPGANTLFAFGLNHKTSTIDVREHLYFSDEEILGLLSVLGRELEEAMVLSTCHRTEVYCVSGSRDIDVNHFKQLIIDYKNAGRTVRASDFFSLTPCSTSQHLFNVATSIDSQVIGDAQILSQVRHAYAIAREAGTTGKILHQLVQRACKLAKQIYNDTSLHRGATSVSLAAVELALAMAGPLEDRTALVIGTGEMARTTAEAFAKRGIGNIIIANRTLEHALSLRNTLTTKLRIPCAAVDLECLNEKLTGADIVVSATGSPNPVLTKESFAGVDRKHLILDIAVPRDVDPAVGELDGIILRNIDHIRSIVDSHHEVRARDLPRVKRMIVDEMVAFLTWFYAQPLLPPNLKKGQKPARAETVEITRVKAFVNDNLKYIHKLAARSNGDFDRDLNNHLALIDHLRRVKAQTSGKALAGPRV